MLCDVESIAMVSTSDFLELEVRVGVLPGVLILASKEARVVLSLTDVRLDLAVQIGPLVDDAFWGNLTNSPRNLLRASKVIGLIIDQINGFVNLF